MRNGTLNHYQYKTKTGGSKTMYKFDREAYDRRMEWYLDARFGMFIHWGLYALPARHEWVKTNEKITEEKYQQYKAQFDAPYRSSEPTDEEKDARIEAGNLAAAYSKMQKFVLQQSNKHHQETIRMLRRAIHES